MQFNLYKLNYEIYDSTAREVVKVEGAWWMEYDAHVIYPTKKVGNQRVPTGYKYYSGICSSQNNTRPCFCCSERATFYHYLSEREKKEGIRITDERPISSRKRMVGLGVTICQPVYRLNKLDRDGNPVTTQRGEKLEMWFPEYIAKKQANFTPEAPKVDGMNQHLSLDMEHWNELLGLGEGLSNYCAGCPEGTTPRLLKYKQYKCSECGAVHSYDRPGTAEELGDELTASFRCSGCKTYAEREPIPHCSCGNPKVGSLTRFEIRLKTVPIVREGYGGSTYETYGFELTDFRIPQKKYDALRSAPLDISLIFAPTSISAQELRLSREFQARFGSERHLNAKDDPDTTGGPGAAGFDDEEDAEASAEVRKRLLTNYNKKPKRAVDLEQGSDAESGDRAATAESPVKKKKKKKKAAQATSGAADEDLF